MVVEDPIVAERERKRDQADQHAIFQALIVACRDAALAFGGYDKAANALDAIWSPIGRPVSPSFLNSTLNPAFNPDQPGTRSYFRIEWVIWFAQHSAEVRDLLIGIGSESPKEPEEELEDIQDVIREELGKTGEALIRKAKARRRRRR